jgi:nucleotide-binding universal stress UspA family protein
VASDLGARSDRVVDRAVSMADALGWPVMLVHVIERDKAASDERNIERLKAMVREDLGALADRIEVRFEHGPVPSTLARIAAQVDAPLIVTGAARFNSPVDFVLGTAVDFLVRRSPVPVLVVRRRSRLAYRRVLVVTDFSHCSQAALEAADDFFPDVPIELLHALPGPYPAGPDRKASGRHARVEAEREMADFVSEIELSLRSRVTPRVEEGALEALVEDRFLRRTFDLLVLGTHGRGAVAHAMIGSRAAALLAAAPCDVMVVRERW